MNTNCETLLLVMSLIYIIDIYVGFEYREKAENASVHWHVKNNAIYPVDSKKALPVQSYVFGELIRVCQEIGS